MIYLDNAATSFPKPQAVYDEMMKCMREYCANPGRGGHELSIQSGKAVMDAREALARFFHISDPMQLCFTKNATEALNIALHGVLQEGDHVIVSCMEHNSVMRPLRTLEKSKGISLTICRGNSQGETDIDDVIQNITPRTRLIVSTLSSNVNGVIMPVAQIGKIARERGIIFLVDASQGAGGMEIDVQQMKIDLMAFPGHKGLLGPQGTGGLYIRSGLELQELMQGGTGSNSEYPLQPAALPDRFESGTLNTPGIVGLRYGLRYIEEMGIQSIQQRKHLHVHQLHQGIGEMKHVKVYSIDDMHRNSGIIAFNFAGVDSNEVSHVLDKAFGIASRAGLHCAPCAHETLGTLHCGIVRLSVGCFTTEEDVILTLQALQEINSSL